MYIQLLASVLASNDFWSRAFRQRLVFYSVTLTLVVSGVLSGCRSPAAENAPTSSAPADTPGVASVGTPTNQETATPRPTATATAVPLAAMVNGTPIALANFDDHLHRLLDALAESGKELAPDEAASLVLNDLIDQALLSQAATASGFELDAAQLEQRFTDLASNAGGVDELKAWMQAHHYTEESFREDLALSIAAAWMRDRIADTVPMQAEQVHARQIFLLNLADAQTVLERIQTGVDFDALAQTYDPQGFGELGWFPEGYLTEPAVESAAFSLQADEVSGIIETELGYHIVKVIERQAERPLDPDARLTLQIRALERWLAQEREQGQIRILLPEFGT